MFVRFRRTKSRLQLSLIETRRINGKVRHEHIASLGSIRQPLTAADRVAYWQALFARLDRLSNRLDDEARTKMMDQISARIPVITPDDVRAVQLENTKVEAKQNAMVRDIFSDKAKAHDLLAHREGDLCTAAKGVVDHFGESAQRAEARAAAIERGEVVQGGLHKPDGEALLKAIGWTAADQRFAELLALVPEEHFREMVRTAQPTERSQRQRTTRAALAIIRKYGTRSTDATGSGNG
jgi:hypothetical protein